MDRNEQALRLAQLQADEARALAVEAKLAAEVLCEQRDKALADDDDVAAERLEDALRNLRRSAGMVAEAVDAAAEAARDGGGEI